jgi:autotransporter-associated beta strand protein
VANGTIDFGGGSIQQTAQINYTGSGETTDRIINFQFNGNSVNRVIDTSGSANSLLKFTSPFTSNGTATNNVILQGSTNGEIVHGLPFAFTNLTKSGNGTWTLGGVVGSGNGSSGAGIVTVNAGTLALKQKSSLMGGDIAKWTAAKINVKSGATLAVNVDSSDAAGISAASLNTLLGNISTGVTSAILGLQGGARIGLDTSTATGGSFTQGNVIANSTGSGGFNGAIGLTKLGTGTLVFDKTNTYTGTTVVSEGTLNITSSGSTHASSAVSVTGTASLVVNGTVNGTLSTAAGTTLSGTGTISGSATISGIHNPGNSPGIQTFGANLTYSGGSSVVNWELTADTSTNAPNPSAIFDQLLVTGDLNFAAATTVNLLFDGAGSSVSWTDSFWNSSQDWLVYDVAGTTSGFSNLTLTNANWLDGDDNPFNSFRPGSSFSFSQVGQDIYLNYTVVPEPSTALLGGLGVLALLRRRRK